MPSKLKEADITKQIRDVLNIPARAGKLWYFKVAGGPLQRSGIPDIIGVYKGKFFAIEVKRPGLKPTPKQMAELKAIEQAGGIAIVAYDPEWVIEALGLGFELTPLFRS
jgi:penicillin-binding protein-related factor A (putative recombinase)